MPLMPECLSVALCSSIVPSLSYLCSLVLCTLSAVHRRSTAVDYHHCVINGGGSSKCGSGVLAPAIPF